MNWSETGGGTGGGKPKINPFEGGLSNKSFGEFKKPENEQILSIDKIFGNKENLKTIVDFLAGYKIGIHNPVKFIVLRGNIGCGKITLLKACLKNTNYSYQLFDIDEECDNIFKKLMIAMESKGFDKLFQQKGCTKKAIIIRSVDDTLTCTQKNELYKFIQMSNNTIPVLMTSCDRSVGTTRELPKCALQLNFENPDIDDLCKHFTSVKISKKALEQSFTDSNNDLRYVSNMVNGSLKKINITKIGAFKKDITLDTFEAIKYCNNPVNQWPDKLLHASMYTNSTVFHNYPNLELDADRRYQIADMMCLSEIITQYSFTTQSWDIFSDAYNIFGTVGPLLIVKPVDIGVFDKLTYPSSNITQHKERDIGFCELESNSVLIKTLVPKYFVKNKFVGDDSQFLTDIKHVRKPILAYKLAHMMNDQKKNNTFLREFRKKIIYDDDKQE